VVTGEIDSDCLGFAFIGTLHRAVPGGDEAGCYGEIF